MGLLAYFPDDIKAGAYTDVLFGLPASYCTISLLVTASHCCQSAFTVLGQKHWPNTRFIPKPGIFT